MAEPVSRTLGGFYDLVLLRYSGEITLKSPRVRRRLMDHLIQHVRNVVMRHGLDACELEVTRSRLFITVPSEREAGVLHAVLPAIPGLVSFSFCNKTGASIETIKAAVIHVAGAIIQRGESFAIRVTREGTHEFGSPRIAALAGEAVLDAFKDRDICVNLTRPARTVHVEVRNAFAYVYHEKCSALGGMPRDIGSAVVAPLGLDDTSWRLQGGLLSRGANVIPLLVINPGRGEGKHSIDDVIASLNHDASVIEKLSTMLNSQEKNIIDIGCLVIDGMLVAGLERVGLHENSTPWLFLIYLVAAREFVSRARTGSAFRKQPRGIHTISLGVSTGTQDGRDSLSTISGILALASDIMDDRTGSSHLLVHGLGFSRDAMLPRATSIEGPRQPVIDLAVLAAVLRDSRGKVARDVFIAEFHLVEKRLAFRGQI